MNGGESGKYHPAGIDWPEVFRRMEEARSKLEQEPGPEEKKALLRKRAQTLAKEPQATAEGERIEVLEFLLAQEHYGIESSYVREVWPLRDLTPVPCTPPFVLGIINVRGRILSVLDLKKFLDLPEKGLGDLNRVIILESDGMEFGVLADVILGVRSVPLKRLQQSIPTLAGVGQEYFSGIFTGEGLVLLDTGRILKDRRIVVNEEIF